MQHIFTALTNIRHRKNETLGPLQVLLISYARTGSSFVGDLLQSMFYKRQSSMLYVTEKYVVTLIALSIYSD